MGWVSQLLPTGEGQPGERKRVWVGLPEVTYMSECPKHGVKSSDFVGQNVNGYIFRCQGPKRMGGKAKTKFEEDMNKHVFAAEVMECYHQGADTPEGKKLDYVWQKGEPLR